MRNIVVKSLLSFGVASGTLCAVLFVAAIISSAQVRAQSQVFSSGERLITLHDDGKERGILTRATTLRQALLEANIPVDANDLIEPSLDEQLVASNYDANIYRARPVTVVDGTVRQKVMSPYQTAKQIAFHAGITLQNEDTADLRANTDMLRDGAGMQMNITRATPFTLVLYGTKTTAYTQAKTVGEMLESKHIAIAPEDTLSVAKETAISANMTIELWRNGKQTATEERDEPFATEKIKDADRPVGYRQVKTPGTLGKRTVTYEIDMRDGKEVARREIQSVITVEPKKQVEIVGVKNNYSGSLSQWLLALRTCETGGVYTRNSGNGYYGAYQFLPGTWNNAASKTGRADLVGVRPDLASPSDQDAMVVANTRLSKTGLASQHPGCYKKLGLSQFPPS